MKKYYFIVFFLLTLFFFPKTVFAETLTGRASVGRGHVMDTSNNYFSTDWKLLSDSSLNILPVPSGVGNNFYQMGTEYSFPITLTGQTDFVATVRVPVAGNTIYTYQLMDGLNQYDFKAGVDQNFAVYNVTPDIQLFNHTCGVYPHLGVAHFYCYYDITFSFTLSTPLTGAYNLNFAVLNSNGSRSSYYLSGGNSGVSIEFPTTYFIGDSWDYSVMSPTVRLTIGTTSNNQDVIDQSIANTQEIKDTIQESYENLVKSQEVCYVNFLTSSSINGKNIYFNGKTNYNQSFLSSGSYTVSCSNCNNSVRYLYRESNGSNINVNNGDSFTISSSGSFWLWSNDGFSSVPDIKLLGCKNGNQATYDFATQPFDDNIGGTLFDGIDWYENSHFSSIITAPIAFLNSLNDSCNSVTLTYRGKDIVLPCGTTVFWERDLPYISTFRGFWNIMIGGLIIYRLGLALVMTINDCLDPTKDKVGGFDI